VNVAVIALGKIGLPLAVQIAGKGHRVLGVDISEDVVERVNRGEAPFPGEADLDRLLAEAVGAGLLTATGDTAAAVADSEVAVVVVPLGLDDDQAPDFGSLDSATELLASALRPGHLVSYETTLPVGTTRLRLAPALAKGSGLTVGDDLNVVHSPERVSSGRVLADLRRYPKLVGGVTNACTAAGVAFYKAILDFDVRPDLDNGVWDVGSSDAAEMTKLAETTYRDINIALANEFARFAEAASLDVNRIIEAANSQPYSHIHSPGVAVGGHCIPIYPRLYLEGDPDAALPAAARAVNDAVPERVVKRLDARLGGLEGRTILILGASYRGNIKASALSGAFPLAAAIERSGGTPLVDDPWFSDSEIQGLGLAPYTDQSIDAAILQAAHDEYTRLGPEDLPGCSVIFDGRNALDPDAWPGVEVIKIGVGT
jgi:nucleotide sugar dehydrogenase